MRAKRAGTIWHVIAVVSFLLSLSQDGFACSCVGPRGKEALAGAAAAFSGKVVQIERLDADEPRGEPRIIVTFEVYRWWKGQLKKSVVLHTIYNKWSCEGYFFKEGGEYVVFAYRNREHMAEKFPFAKDTLGVTLCGGTKVLANANDELRELGAGRRP
jgi:hypothetical protein